MLGSYTRLAKSKQNKTNKSVRKEVQKTVKSMLQKDVEVKYFDQYQLSTNVTAVGTLACISDIVRGTDVTQRVGNEIMLKSIQVRLGCYINANATQTALRYLIVHDTMGVNAPSVSDILEAAFLTSYYSEVAPLYWDYRKRFRILKDKVIYLCKQSSISGYAEQFSLKLGFRSYQIGSSTTFKNQVYLLLVSNEPNVLNTPVVNIHTRIMFTDE